MGSGDYKHWCLKTDDQHVLWAYLDRQDASINSLNDEVLDELCDILHSLSAQNTKRGLVITSKKTSGFILGADIQTLSSLTDAKAALAFIKKGQAVFNQLEELTIPSVALISGYCLGGGLELALACRYRLAKDDPSTLLGLPEVLLGLHPGWGGTVRLPRLVGGIKAMELILSGRMLSAKAAEKLGIIDAAVPDRHYQAAAGKFLHDLPMPHRCGSISALSNNKLARPFVARQLRGHLKKRRIQSSHYPAPFAAIEQWERYGVDHPDAMDNEADSLGRCVQHPSASNLIRVFKLQERLKKMGTFNAFHANRVHVVGAGTMGADIAAWCALKGCTVTIMDKKAELIALAVKKAYALFKKKLKKPRLIQAAMDRFIPDQAGFGVQSADIIIEAIFEDLAIKQSLFSDLEKKARSDALLASNTSTFMLDRISEGLQDPSRLVGIHFFNPVAKMKLVEVVHNDQTKEDTLQQATAFVKQIGRLPLPVLSSPGFLVNRVLMPYLLESVTLLEEDVPAAVIDSAALDFGMLMGPIELADVVGLDICLHAANSMAEHLPVRIPDRLRQMVAKGTLGKKTGQGFYAYKKGRRQNNHSAAQFHAPEDITDRLMLRLINEAVACLREKVVSDADLVDVGLIFGAGFAPFRGGPMHYSQSTGVMHIHQQLQSMHSRYGERFNPDSGWHSLLSQT